MSEPLAHSGGHLLHQHWRSVAAVVAGFLQMSDSDAVTLRLTYLAGLWHDLGQYQRATCMK